MQQTDILVLIEAKIDNTFPTAQFLVNGFSEPYRLNRNRNGGRLMIQIPSKQLKMFFPFDMEGLFVELNFRKCKWLIFGTYHPPSQADIYYFYNLEKAFDTNKSYTNNPGVVNVVQMLCVIVKYCLYTYLKYWLTYLG